MKKIGSDKPFGASALSRLKIGDLVEWSVLETDEDKKWYERKSQGILIDILTEEFGGREVYFGEVIPVKNHITCRVFLYLLERVTI